MKKGDMPHCSVHVCCACRVQLSRCLSEESARCHMFVHPSALIGSRVCAVAHKLAATAVRISRKRERGVYYSVLQQQSGEATPCCILPDEGKW